MNLFSREGDVPLAERVRPRTLDEYVGQGHVLGQDDYVRRLVTDGRASSMILWGPPGTGKTTLARIVARASDAAFEELSAVTSGLADVRKVIDRASERKRLGQATVLFVDEIHRFNKAQQDAFLPHIETGTIIFIGATTENPSFEVIGPLLSRTRVVVLRPLSEEHLQAILTRGLGELGGIGIVDAARKELVGLAAGDARRLLNGLEAAASLSKGAITLGNVRQALQQPTLAYDKNGAYHYDLVSALIKSLRGGSVDAAMFYVARMIDGGEDPKFIARRLVIFAAEDVGLADNAMLTLATTTFLAIERIGLPEGRIILGQCVVALAKAPKNRDAYDAIGRAAAAVADHPTAEVPLHLRNAPTKLMAEQGYGKDYVWEAGHVPDNGFMPEELRGRRFYTPTKDTAED